MVSSNRSDSRSIIGQRLIKEGIVPETREK